jgi:hypothetical protein
MSDETVSRPKLPVAMVLHVLCSLDERDGGPIRAVFDLSSRALQLGYPSEILGFGDSCNVQSSFPIGLVHRLPGGRYPKVADVAALKRWMDKNAQRYVGIVLHGMWLWQLSVVAYCAYRASVPYASFPHGMIDHWPWRGQGILKLWKKQLYWWLFEGRVVNGAHKVFFTTKREMLHARQLVKIKSTRKRISRCFLERGKPLQFPADGV